MGLFPDEFKMHLIRSLLNVLPRFTSHEHNSTVSQSIIPHHCADWYNGFSSAWIMSVNVCLYKQALVLVPRFSSSPMCCCLHVWQSGINTKNIFIFYQKWTTTKNQNDNFTYEFSDRKNLPLLKLSSAAWASCPASTGEVQQLFWAQKEKSWVAFSKENIASWFALPQCVLGTASSWDGKWRKRRKRPWNVHFFWFFQVILKFPIQKAEMKPVAAPLDRGHRVCLGWDVLPLHWDSPQTLKEQKSHLKTMSRFTNWTLKN